MNCKRIVENAKGFVKVHKSTFLPPPTTSLSPLIYMASPSWFVKNAVISLFSQKKLILASQIALLKVQMIQFIILNVACAEKHYALFSDESHIQKDQNYVHVWLRICEIDYSKFNFEVTWFMFGCFILQASNKSQYNFIFFIQHISYLKLLQFKTNSQPRINSSMWNQTRKYLLKIILASIWTWIWVNQRRSKHAPNISLQH